MRPRRGPQRSSAPIQATPAFRPPTAPPRWSRAGIMAAKAAPAAFSARFLARSIHAPGEMPPPAGACEDGRTLPGTLMIARIWRGITLAEKADAYIARLKETGLKDYANTPGNRGV